MGWRDRLLKNARNYAEYLRKKERGPVKAFFHITKNENVPAIEQQGLLTNHPNANINSANHPFRKHGTDAGGVWVTTEPTAFPVYGTTIGGKNGNAAARADALSTIKIEVPLPELRKMKAVQDPYGKNILRKGDDPRAVEKFGTWAGTDVPTTVLLDDVKPQWLKNIGYVEEEPGLGGSPTYVELAELPSGWALARNDPLSSSVRGLSKGDFKELVGYTGHRHGMSGYDRAQRRFIDDYLDKNQPITKRLPKLPNDGYVYDTSVDELQYPYHLTEENHEYLREMPLTAHDWTEMYRPYIKPGEVLRKVTFQPGAYSRGIGHNVTKDKFGSNIIRKRHFNWNTFNENIANGESPFSASFNARPSYRLDWDNIVYSPEQGYHPNVLPAPKMSEGHITAGPDWGHVGTSEGAPWTLYDVYKIRHDPNLTAADRMNYRDDLVRRIYDDGVATGIIKDISPKATWREIMQAMMKIQTGK